MNDVEVTSLLEKVNRGEPDAFNLLVSALYSDLREVAASLMRNQRVGHTLQPTALVHEAWLRLAGREAHWDGRSHFFGAATRAMRQALVAHARQHAARKRGGDGLRVTFRELDVAVEEPGIDLLALDDALNALSEVDEHLTRVMEMRYFGGFSLPEIGELAGRSLASIKRDWAYARAWLYDHMTSVSAVADRHGS